MTFKGRVAPFGLRGLYFRITLPPESNLQFPVRNRRVLVPLGTNKPRGVFFCIRIRGVET